MSTPPRTLVPLVVVAFAFIALAGCSNSSPASVTNADDNAGTEDTEPTDDAPCSATATVNGTAYHVVRVVSQDYGVKPTFQVDGTSSDCSGEGEYPLTFHAIPHVNPAWALCGLVDGSWHVFLADELQVPADSHLARIVVGAR